MLELKFWRNWLFYTFIKLDITQVIVAPRGFEEWDDIAHYSFTSMDTIFCRRTMPGYICWCLFSSMCAFLVFRKYFILFECCLHSRNNQMCQWLFYTLKRNCPKIIIFSTLQHKHKMRKKQFHKSYSVGKPINQNTIDS